MWQAEKFCSHNGQYNDGYEHAYEDSWSAEQTGTSESGVEIKISRYYWGLNWAIPAQSATFTYGGESVTTPTFPYWISEGFYRSQTLTKTIVFPSSWAGKEINWSIGNYTGTFLFDGYGQFTLTIITENSTATVERQSSPSAEADTGELADGAAIYTDDVLKITATVPTGYKLSTLTSNGTAINSGENVTVNGDMAIASKGEPMATTDVYTGGAWGKHLIYIYSSGAWGLYQAEIYSGGAWSKYF